jgi:lipoprotein-anchoring transpeptidase ErfK/SrfK
MIRSRRGRRSPRPGRAALGAVALASAALAIGLAAAPGGAPPTSAVELPPPPAPAFVVPRPVPLARAASESVWATVRREVAGRAAPDPAASVLTRVPARTPEGTTNIVTVLARRRDEGGRLWVRVRLAVLPNGSTGWVPRSALGGYHVLDSHLVVSLRGQTATLTRGRRTVFRAPVAVGKARWPTPTGRFYIRNRLTRYASPAYGPVAFGTSARSSVLTDWPAGGFIGIHGTDQPQLVPGRASHGCIRLRNRDIVELARLMPVGTPLTIRA